MSLMSSGNGVARCEWARGKLGELINKSSQDRDNALIKWSIERRPHKEVRVESRQTIWQFNVQRPTHARVITQKGIQRL